MSWGKMSKSTLTLDQATICKAVQYWLNNEVLQLDHQVTKVEKDSSLSSYGNEVFFVTIESTEAEPGKMEPYHE